jgi:xylulokinase
MDLFLGIDLGASSLKASLVDNHGRQLDDARVAIITTNDKAGFSEQDPEQWRVAMAAACMQLAAPRQNGLDDVKAVSFSAGAHIAVLCDSAARPLRPAILWSDQRAAPQAKQLAKQGRVEAISGNRPHATWTLPQLLWLKTHEPDILHDTKMLFFAKDWLRYQLTGHHCSDPSEAVGAMLADKTGQWAAELQNMSGLAKSSFPPLIAPGALAGTVSQTASRVFGIPVGTTIYQGAIDTSMEWLCVAPQKADMASLKLASAGVLAFTTKSPRPVPPVSYYPHIIDAWHYHAAGMSDCMGAIEWARETFTPHLTPSQFAKAAANAPLGAQGLLFYPYLSGARAPFWDATLTAELTGLTRGHDSSAIARAAYEGVAHVLLAIWQDMTEQLGHAPPTLHVLGGGTQFGFFCQILADMLNVRLTLGQHSDSAFATALLAATAHGAFDDLPSAAQAGYDEVHQFVPDIANHARYAHAHEKFMARHS